MSSSSTTSSNPRQISDGHVRFGRKVVSAQPVDAYTQDEDAAWWIMAVRAVQQSRLTLPSSAPFHLSVEIIEITEADSDYNAKVGENWVSPEKWQLAIQSPGFSRTLIVNGDKILEQYLGDYFP